MMADNPATTGGATSIAEGVDDEVIASNQRVFSGSLGHAMAALCVLYTGFHIFVMNVYPLETWVYRLLHVGGGLALGFMLFAARGLPEGRKQPLSLAERVLTALAGAALALAGGQLLAMWATGDLIQTGADAGKHVATFGWPLMAGTALALAAAWIAPARDRGTFSLADGLLSLGAVIVAGYIILHADFLRVSEHAKVNVNVPVSFINEEKSPGLKRGGVLNVVRHELELVCDAAEIPDQIVIDMTGFDVGEAVHISHVVLPKGSESAITDRDFTIATVVAPSSLKSQEGDTSKEEGEEGEEAEGGEE